MIEANVRSEEAASNILNSPESSSQGGWLYVIADYLENADRFK